MGDTSQFESLSHLAQFDDGPGRHRIGLITLSNDYVTERDFMNMRPSNDVAIFGTRVANTPDCTVETLHQMAPHITEAASLIVPQGQVDVVAYSCTSGTAVMGFEKVQSLIHAARPGVPCVTPITSSIAALQKFDASRLAILTPYIDEVNIGIANYLQKAEFVITAFSTFDIAQNERMACLSTESIYSAALDADRADAEALFISCTAIRAVDVVDRIEQTLGKPVVTAVQAMFWQALRLSGYSEPVQGYGRLLRLT
jgi:maleate isomerase